MNCLNIQNMKASKNVNPNVTWIDNYTVYLVVVFAGYYRLGFFEYIDHTLQAIEE